MSNLPPGCTQKMIDDYFSGPCEDCEEGNHQDCKDSECRCDECDEAAREAAGEAAYERWKDDRDLDLEPVEPEFGD